MIYIHFCSAERMLQGRQRNSHPQISLNNEHEENSSKVAIKCWKMPHFNPERLHYVSNTIYILQIKIRFKFVDTPASLQNFQDHFKNTSAHYKRQMKKMPRCQIV